MDQNNILNKEEENTPIDELSLADQTIDYTDMIAESAFIGDIPYDTIKEVITEQFNDYINMDDETNYVDLFYEQLYTSYEKVRSDDSEEHPMEIIDALDKIKEDFIEMMTDLFDQRLTIHLSIDDKLTSDDDIEYVIRRLYEFFILDAKNNFKVVIAKDMIPKLKNIEDDREYFNKVRSELSNYSPLIICMGADKFLSYKGDEEVQEIFNDGKATGNFLRKYSAKLYQNEEFEVEIINYITLLNDFRKEITDGTK